MEAGKNTKTGSIMMMLKARFNLKFKIIVAVVAGFLMAAPLTRVYKLNYFEPFTQADEGKQGAP